MAENTTVGPAGSNHPALGSSKPDNHGTTQNGGGEAGASGNGEALAGPDQGGQDTFSNAGGGPAGDDTSLNGGDRRTVGIDGKIPK